MGKFRGAVPTALDQHLMKAMNPLHIRLLTGLRTATGIFQGMDGFLLYYLQARDGRRICSRFYNVVLGKLGRNLDIPTKSGGFDFT